MNPTEIEFAVRALVAEPYDPATFAFDLIAIYNTPKVTVSKLKSGQTNATKKTGDVLWKKRLYFRSASSADDVAVVGDELVLEQLTVKNDPRFIVVTNGDQVHIRDRHLDDTCNTEFSRLDESSDFLLPLAGYERRAAAADNPADVKAAKRLAKLYDAILGFNPMWNDGNHTHELNLFMTRILFCFYAEDTGIFDISSLFTNTVAQHTKEDGSDVAPLLNQLFRIMNMKNELRPVALTATIKRFPYVNGSLFEDTLSIPNFNRTARRLFLECGELDWKTINPDIFGSMIQTITEPGARGDLGMHYTSVPNIMKVIGPLFLHDLNDAYDKGQDSVSKLEALKLRLSQIRVFDPACGCGNFLIIAYKELRQLEMRVFGRIAELAPNNPLILSGISLHNFFGIDIVDFACETTKLSLWIAEYQMNSAFKALFGAARPPLPLGKIATIRNENALRTDWFEVCEPNGAETYICGNPPYQGFMGQTSSQKADITHVFATILRAYKDVDYVSCWFVKLSDYINATEHTAGAFVATNSICQGEQVAFLWPYVFSLHLTIMFAHTSFRWTNSASHNAGVTCVVVGLAKASARPKHLYNEQYHTAVANINSYLVPSSSNLIIDKSSSVLNGLPVVVLGNRPVDDGNLILSPSERLDMITRYPESASMIRRFYGSKEFIQSIERYALWITADQLSMANDIAPIAKRLLNTRKVRLAGGPQARASAGTPYRFAYISYRATAALTIPRVSSERRHYLQIGLLDKSDIANDQLYVVYDHPAYLLALLSSRLHRIWTETVGGKLESRLRYSITLIYNTFPVPTLSESQKLIIADNSKAILKARAKHPGKTIAWLYNPETMPANLLEAHHANDSYLEEYVYGHNFKDDTQRLAHLFTLYARMKEKAASPSLLSGSGKKGR